MTALCPRAVAVFVGVGEMGPWQQREKYLALDRQARDAAFPVIPVLLPGADPALGFLGQNMWVDLRERPDAPSTLALLAAAIRGEAPGAAARETVDATRATVCPYRGLLYTGEVSGGHSRLSSGSQCLASSAPSFSACTGGSRFGVASSATLPGSRYQRLVMVTL